IADEDDRSVRKAADEIKALDAQLEAHPLRAKLGEALAEWRAQLDARQQRVAEIEAGDARVRVLAMQIGEHDVRGKQAEAALAKASTALDIAQRDEATQQSKLAELLKGREETDVRRGWQSLQTRQGVLDKLQQLAKTRDEAAKRLAQIIETIAQRERAHAEQTQARAQVETHYRAVREQIRDKEKLIEQERRILELSAYRAALRPGAPCELCGSTEHPAISEYQALDVSQTQRALDASKTKLAELETQGLKLKQSLAALQGEVDQLRQQRAALDKDEGERALLWDSLCESVRLEHANRAGLDEALEANVQAVREAQTTLQSLDALRDALERAVKARIGADKAVAEAHHARQLVDQAKTQAIAQHTQATEQVAQLRADLETRTRALTTSLQAWRYESPDDWGDAQAWLNAREREWHIWQQAVEQRRQLVRQSDSLAQRSDVARQEVQKWQARWTAWVDARTEDSLEREPLGKSDDARAAFSEAELAVDHAQRRESELSGTEQGLIARVEQTAREAIEAGEHWRRALTASPFADESSFTAALLDADERDRLMQSRKQLDDALLGARRVQQAAKQRWAELSMQAKTEATSEALSAERDALQATVRKAAERQGEVKAQLQNDDNQRTTRKTLFDQIAAKQTDYDGWQRLNSLIGSADGAKYRKFAQGLTLDHLIHLANRQLVRLHGRYALNRKTSGELEIEVVDTWQGDSARDTRTLSGGESFLVSLALALALSDLVSHKTSIDSLFLDEGFGTLDGETLEIALDALDALNASGKMIGVISHVEALKERIPVQIKVRKRAGVGFSDIEVDQ
ncbi:MAG TPA: SbcC/MukB-like Walker B domain-containing protein, partial [Pararobbsia sp.]|nr:SbcC/MukB-like Walker B domain-containing protein [Pararobbsia sp.]